MKKVIVLLAIGLATSCGFVSYVYMTNRTVTQVIAVEQEISGEWTEFVADPSLSEFRMVAELVFIVHNYKHDPNNRVPWGQFRLPDGRVATPQVEGVDAAGNTVTIAHSGFTMSGKDSIRFSPKPELTKDDRLVKIRIRSDVPFSCEKIFWQNRNMK